MTLSNPKIVLKFGLIRINNDYNCTTSSLRLKKICNFQESIFSIIQNIIVFKG